MLALVLVILISIIFFYIPRLRIPIIALAAPWYVIRFAIGDLPTTLLEIVIIAAALSFVPEVSHSQRREQFKKRLIAIPGVFLVLAGLFFLSTIIALVATPEFHSAFGLWRAYVLESILVSALIILTTEKNTWRDTLIASALSSIIVSLVALWQWFHPEGVSLFGTTLWQITDPIWSATATRRSTSVFGYPNAIGLYLAPLIPLYLSQLPWRGHAKSTYTNARVLGNAALLIASILSVVAIFCARSHGAIAGLVAGLVFATLVIMPKKGRIIALCALILLGALAIPSSTRYLTGFSFQKPSGELRLGQWQETMRMLGDHPLLGGGLTNYQNAILPYHSKKLGAPFLYPHSLILNFWTEFGILGALSWLGLVMSTLWILFKTTRPLSLQSIALMSSLIVIIVHGLVDVPYFKNDLALLFWIIITFSVLQHSSQSSLVSESSL